MKSELLYSPQVLLTSRPNLAGQFLDDSNLAGQFLDISNPAGQFLDDSNPAGQFLDVSKPAGQFFAVFFKKKNKSKKIVCLKKNFFLLQII